MTQVELPPIRRDRDDDWTSFEDMMQVFEDATSYETWLLILAWSAAPLPGVLWHCEKCREHTSTPTLLQVPSCHGPMNAEAITWLQEAFDERAATIAVALRFMRE